MAVNWSRRGEYIAKRNHTPAMADEAVTDIAAVVIDPDYNSKTNQSVRTIGYSTTAGAVLTVITYEEDGVTYGATAFKSNGRDRRYYRQGGTDE
ncbi:MAG: transposase [Actinomycetia bacterium]|nr:transposase [Actinomycetes bacterium]